MKEMRSEEWLSSIISVCVCVCVCVRTCFCVQYVGLVVCVLFLSLMKQDKFIAIYWSKPAPRKGAGALGGWCCEGGELKQHIWFRATFLPAKSTFSFCKHKHNRVSFRTSAHISSKSGGKKLSYFFAFFASD